MAMGKLHMRYLDSGSRDPDHALAAWFRRVLTDEVVALRWQSGFFAIDGVGELQATLLRLTERGQQVSALVGSNNGDTLAAHVVDLVYALGIPRPAARLGVIHYAAGFFHPKTYHIRRQDGSEAAYVGSANLTGAGVASLHAEAGIVLDTRDGDHRDVLAHVAAAIDGWFDGARGGFYAIENADSVAALAVRGVLAEAPPPPRPGQRAENEDAAAGPPLHRLRALIELQPFRYPQVAQENAAAGDNPPNAVADQLPAADDVDPPDEAGAPRPVAGWEILWTSSALSERDLSIPTGENTHKTSSMLLKKGAGVGDADFRHYFREVVFQNLDWYQDRRRAHHSFAQGEFEIVVDDILRTTAELTVTHNADVNSATYQQRNAMTGLRWGEALPFIAREELLGGQMRLYREVGTPAGERPRFRIRIDRAAV